MTVWNGDEGVAEAMVKGMVWWGAAKGRIGLFGGAGWGVVGGKHGGWFKDERQVGGVGGTGEDVTCSDFSKGKTVS